MGRMIYAHGFSLTRNAHAPCPRPQEFIHRHQVLEKASVSGSGWSGVGQGGEEDGR
jgi:hypothetical protein